MSIRRPFFAPLVPLYAAGLWVKERMGGAQHRLPWPVVSVGSLSAGGAGKTPVVMLLAELLTERAAYREALPAITGSGVRILSRGYGRSGSAVERVDAAGSAEQFGDEPLLMARRGYEVWVGADRYVAGAVAIAASTRPGIFLLDDGFQHRVLARDLDIALLTLQDAEDWLLPAGDLREPMRALGRADVIVVREEEAGALLPRIEGLGKEVWTIRRTLLLPPEDLLPKRPLVFCGIARPEGFVAMLKQRGCEVVEVMALPDHHAYADRDIERLMKLAARAGADGFITTEKDAVKLTLEMRRRMDTVGPVVMAQLRVEFADDATRRRAARRLLSLADQSSVL